MLSLNETEWLLHDPFRFFKDIFTYGYSHSGNVFSGTNSYWNDLKSNLIVKLLALLNVLTNKSYYTNIILFNLLFFFGLVALLRVVQQEFGIKKWILAGVIFLIPATLFWCSGIHKDGLILSATGLVIFWFHQLLKTGKLKFSCLTGIIICIILIFLLRSYVALALLPALFSWWLCLRFQKNSLLIFTSVYSVGIGLFFLLPLLSSSLNFPSFLATKQHEFLLLSGGSSLPVKPLYPDLVSFMRYLPTALDIGFFRPHISEAKNPASVLALIELWIIGVLFILALLFPLKNQYRNPFTLFLLFFGISLLLIAGYTVTFTGAVVRYRSFALPFIVLPVLTWINFHAIKLPVQLFANKR